MSIPQRLNANRYELDEEESHIEVNQELARSTGTGKRIAEPLVVNPNRWAFAAFSDGGRSLVTFGETTPGSTWDIDPGSWVQRACEVAGRQLSDAEWEDLLPSEPRSPACDT